MRTEKAYLDRVSLLVGEDVLARLGEIGDAGYAVGNVDATVICETPRLSPYVAAIRSRLAGLLDVDESSVSVKGKTNEGMDAVGQGLGIAVHAVALLVPAEA